MKRTSLVALLAALTVALAGAGAAATPSASFTEDGLNTPQNGSVTFTISFEDTDQAALQVGSEGHGYVLNGTVVDDDSDGTAAVTFDSSNAGTSDTTLSTTDGDAVTVDSETELLNPPLKDNSYPLSLIVNGTTTDVNNLYVTHNTTSDQQTTEPTTEASTTASSTEPTTVSPTETETESPAETTATGQSSNGDAPGFGALAALAAVGAAALLAVRR